MVIFFLVAKHSKKKLKPVPTKKMAYGRKKSITQDGIQLINSLKN
jgi:hypothetical protein